MPTTWSGGITNRLTPPIDGYYTVLVIARVLVMYPSPSTRCITSTHDLFH